MVELYENRVWIDGCFDFTHHGHSGAILQARRTIPKDQRDGSLLICGVHNDADIEHHKGGKPVIREQERYYHTESNKWCDQVVKDAPYVTEPDLLDSYGCKYVVHGDDITTDANGEDCYQQMKDNGRFKVVKRTEGVSTTEIIDRILRNVPQTNQQEACVDRELLTMYSTDKSGYEPWSWVFGQNFDDVIVEGVGSVSDENWVIVEEPDGFDLFNVGHIQQLKKWKQAGKRVCCSMHTEKDVFMTLEERALSALSCNAVDAVLLYPASRDTTTNSKSLHITTSLKDSIIQRINHDRDHYIERNIKKGITYEN